MASVTFSMRLDPEIKQALEDAAKALNRTPGFLANQAIANFLAAEHEKETAIMAAIEKAEAGQLVPAEAVDSWLKSLGTDNPLPMPKAADHA